MRIGGRAHRPPIAGAPGAPGGPGNACNTPAAQKNPNCPLQPIAGFYRAGSDHRKDGAAMGY